jgi:broad specificity phosphatase PhoE
VILVRHGQSHFNVHFARTRRDPGIRDPGLTELGREQAQAIAGALAERDLRRLVVSPYRRTLETAAIILERCSVPVAVEPMVRERCFFVCDLGTPASALTGTWPTFDFAHLEEQWWPEPEETEDELLGRCRSFHATMAETPDWRHVAVITHWGFIRGLTGHEVGNCATVVFDPTIDPSPPAQRPEPA